jgi:hypothetical protein
MESNEGTPPCQNFWPDRSHVLIELWRDHCLRDYPVIAAQYSRGEYEEPLSWRDEFIVRIHLRFPHPQRMIARSFHFIPRRSLL